MPVIRKDSWRELYCRRVAVLIALVWTLLVMPLAALPEKPDEPPIEPKTTAELTDVTGKDSGETTEPAPPSPDEPIPDLADPAEVINTVLHRHPAVKKADDLLRSAEFGVKGSRLQPNPTLQVGLVSVGDAGEGVNTLTQNFEISGQPHLRWKMATEELESAKETLRATRRRVASETYLAWLELWQAARLVELAQLRTSIMQEAEKAAYRRYEVGEISQNESLRVKLATTQAEADAARAQGVLEAAQYSLELLLGLKLKGTLLTPSRDLDSLLPPGEPWNLTGILTGVESHPDIQALDHQRSALEYNAKLTGKERAPIVGLSFNRSSYNRAGPVEQGIMLTVSWPVFDWGRIANQRKQQEAEADAFAAGIEENILTQKQEVSNLWTQLLAARTNRELLSTQSGRYEELAREARIAYDLGMLSLTDVFATEAAFRQASVQLVQAKAEVLTLEVRLLERTGLPWPEDFLKEDL